MGQVSVTLNNRTYRLACNDGEEPRLAELARDVKARVETLARDFGQPADERILLMAAVLLADELMDLREAHEAMLAAAAEVLREAAAQPAATAETGADRGKAESARADAAKKDAAKPEQKSEHKADAGKPQQRQEPRQAASGGNGGSGHPAMPPSATKGAASSAA